MSRVLLVEDSVSSQRVVAAALAPPHYELICVGSFQEAGERIAKDLTYDLILLDLTLPDGEGMELLRDWRANKRFNAVPVLLLSGREDVETKVAAFALGAEDYMVKPINPRELLARVEMRLRKSGEQRETQEVLRRGNLTLNFPLMRAFVEEGDKQIPVEFTAKEFRLVATLATHEGQIFSRGELVKEIWGANMNVVNRTVDSHICGARRKLGAAGRYIQSVTGSGYRFVVTE